MQADPLTTVLVSGQSDDKPRATRRSLPIALLMAREAVMARFRPLLTRHDLSEQQWRVLRMLEEHGELDASELSTRALVLAPSLTRMIKSLEARRFITKRNDRRDGRRVLLSLTSKGRALIAEMIPESRDIYEELEQSYGTAEMTELLDLLEKVIADGRKP